MSGVGIAAGARPPSWASPGSRGTSRPRPRPPAGLPAAGQQGAQAGLSEAQKRVLDLEKSLQFLQQQHSETLVKLHEEIEHILPRQPDEEVETWTPGAALRGGSQHKGRQAVGAGPLASLPPHLRKPTTVQQCEVVIRQLWNANLLQAQELQHLKSLLEGNQGAKAAAEEVDPSSPKEQEATQFPQLSTSKGVSKKCLILSPVPAAQCSILPALKQTLKSNFAERQKRLQVVQSRRLHRSVL